MGSPAAPGQRDRPCSKPAEGSHHGGANDVAQQQHSAGFPYRDPNPEAQTNLKPIRYRTIVLVQVRRNLMHRNSATGGAGSRQRSMAVEALRGRSAEWAVVPAVRGGRA